MVDGAQLKLYEWGHASLRHWHKFDFR